MHPDRIQALIARCLTEADLLSSIPDETDGLGASDLQRIGLFRGFIVKVKHNQVRRVLPLTLRMLPAVGLDLAFFSAYAPAYLTMRSSGPVPLDRQVEQLTTHLKEFLATRSGSVPDAIRDVLTHELKLWSLRSVVVEPAGSRGSGQLLWRGRLQLERYTTDVLSTCGALAAKRFDLGRHVRVGECSLVYWRPFGSDVVEFFEVDELTALLVSVAQRRRTIAGVGRALAAMGVKQISRRDLVDFFSQLAERGFLRCA